MEQKIATFACVGCQYRAEGEQALLVSEMKALSVGDFNDHVWLRVDYMNPHKKTLDPVAWMLWVDEAEDSITIGYIPETDLADFYRIFGHVLQNDCHDDEPYFEVSAELTSAHFTDDKQCRVKWLVFKVTD